MTKSELRKTFLAKQRLLSHIERVEKSSQVAEVFFESFDLIKIKYLHCFIPIEEFNEIDTMPIFQRLWREYPHILTVVPRVNFQSGEMESLLFTETTELASNKWSIKEPLHDDVVANDMIDMVLVPGLCFDLNGHRVGYGKGFYDRFLATCKPDCIKVGLSYFPSVNRIDYIASHDEVLDYCVCADGLQVRDLN
jgi:5-formyltetrahydrofolate cyclo-ligase